MDAVSTIHPGSQYDLYGELYEVITIEPTRISLRSVQHKHPLFFTPDLFNTMRLKGELRLHALALIDQSFEICLQGLPLKQKKSAERKIFYTRGIQECFQGSLPKNAVIKEVARLAKLYDNDRAPSYGSIYLWCRIYRESNYNPFSLIKRPSTRPRGKNLCSETHTIISRFIYKFYLQPKHPSIKTLHKLIWAQIDKENDARSSYSTEKISVPSLSTVMRSVKRINNYYKDTLQLGTKEAERVNNYSVKGNPSPALLRLVEGDSHEMEILVVDELGRVLGHPWLHLLIEVSTRYVIGYELSLTPPCAEKFLKSLRMALSTSDQGYYGGRPIEITVDNGAEAANDAVHNIGDRLCINIHYAPPRTPNAKAIVERFFATLNSQFTHAMEGSTGTDPIIGKHYNAEDGACFQMSQLNRLFDRFIHGVYHNEYHTTIHTSPNDAWATALRNQLPPERFTPTALNGLCRLPLLKSINNGRVQHLNLTWTDPALPDIAARLKPKQKAKVYLDITDLSTVLVAHPNAPTELFEARATDPHYQNNLTLYAHQLVLDKLKEQKRKFDGSLARQTLLEIYNEIWEIKSNYSIESRRKRRQHKKLLLAAERLGMSGTNKPKVLKEKELLPSKVSKEAVAGKLYDLPTYVVKR
jgi:putative transposase